MGNIDFGLDGTFSAYVVALLLTGVLMLALAALVKNQKPVERVLSALIGIGALGYGVYLNWIFEGGEYRLFWIIFILPALLIFNLFKSNKGETAQ